MSKNFTRDNEKFKPEPSVLVICEDTKSSKSYLDEACYKLRADVHIELSHCGNTDPLGIVKAAIKRKKSFEFVLCVIDRDTHENFFEATALAKQNNIYLVISYPCFEFWLLLHFKYSRKPYNKAGSKSPADLLIADLKKITEMENYEKGSAKLLYSYLSDRLPQARINSAKALAEAKLIDTYNPSTTLDVILDFFSELAVPKKTYVKINELLNKLP